MSAIAPSSFSSQLPGFKELTLSLYTNAEDAVALVLTSPKGGALLTSQLGSNIAAYPLRKNGIEDPVQTSERFLASRGFRPQQIPSSQAEEYLVQVMQSSGFCLSQVEQALGMSYR